MKKLTPYKSIFKEDFTLPNYKSIFKESHITKGKILKQDKTFLLISFPYPYGDLRNLIKDPEGGYSNTVDELLDEIYKYRKIEMFLSDIEKVGPRIELSFNKA
jgi:hypothetical protein